MTDRLIRDYVKTQKRLLELELRSEEEEETITTATAKNTDNNEENGRASRIIRNLQVDQWNVGLMGRTVIDLIPIKGDMIQKDTKNGNNHDDQKESKLTNKNSKNNKSVMRLPAHKITVGDEVEIISKYGQQQQQHNGRRKKSGGVVSSVTETVISIALYGDTNTTQTTQNQQKSNIDSSDQQVDDTQILGSPPLTIVPKSSVEVHKKMIHVLNKLESEGEDHEFAGKIIQAVFDPTKLIDGEKQINVCCNQNESISLFNPFNPNLDESQIDAIKFCLQDRPISLIHGPPGTGKTTTVAELIHQAVHVHNLRVLVTAPSNVAVDNVLERLVSNNSISNKGNNNNDNIKKSKRNLGKKDKRSAMKIRAVRLGHPARIQTSILRYSLEALVQSADGTEIVSDIRLELQNYLKLLSNPKSKGMEKRKAYQEMKVLRKEIRQREEKVVQSLISNAQVILATNVGAASSILDKYEKSPMSKPFDLVIIDEAAQALEVSCWIPILRGKRVVLAGDHCQLPPTIKSSSQEVQKGLGTTMFERIMKYNKVAKMLQIQYRMHADIANWASEAMYGGLLISHDTVKSRKLHDLDHLAKCEAVASESEDSLVSITRNATLLLIDTAGSNMFEEENAAGSRYNEGEAHIVEKHVRYLLQIGLKQEEIAVITPYNGQVEILKSMLLFDFPKLEIRSVDGFQGGEREAVVLSLVRSSDRHGANGIGFLKDRRRLNVAVTRAKRQCTVICDSDTVNQDKFLKGLVTWIESKGEYLSAMEYYNPEPKHQKSITDFPDIKHEFDQRKLHSPRSKVTAKNIVQIKQQKPEDEPKNEQEIKEVPDKVNGDDRSTKVEEVKIQIIPVLQDNQHRINHSKHVSDDACSPDESTSDSKDLELICESSIDNNGLEDKKDVKINALLGELAQERQARAQVALTDPKQNLKKMKKKASKKGNKLGGLHVRGEKEAEDDLDDMAFLDSQIERMQNSHGRTLEGRGKNYRKIVNGILIRKPKHEEKKQDPGKKSALQAKIKQAADSRKAKKKK